MEQLANFFEKNLYNIQIFSAFDQSFLELFAEKYRKRCQNGIVRLQCILSENFFENL